MSAHAELYTTSRLRAAQRCARYHHYRYDLGAHFDADEALRFGTGVHAALEAWFKAIRAGSFPLACALDALADLDADPFERARMTALVVGYDARWGDSPYEVLAVEIEFRCEIEGVPFGGKIDAIVRDRRDGRIYIVEHKTSGQDLSPGSAYWERLRLDTQITVYTDGAASLGFDIDGVIYDVLARPAQRPLKATPEDKRKITKAGALYKGQRADDETAEDFEKRITEAIAEDPDGFYQRRTIVRLANEMPALRRDLVETVELIRFGKRADMHPRNPDACANFGRLCGFFAACSGATTIDTYAHGPVHRELAAA